MFLILGGCYWGMVKKATKQRLDVLVESVTERKKTKPGIFSSYEAPYFAVLARLKSSKKIPHLVKEGKRKEIGYKRERVLEYTPPYRYPMRRVFHVEGSLYQIMLEPQDNFRDIMWDVAGTIGLLRGSKFNLEIKYKNDEVKRKVLLI